MTKKLFRPQPVTLKLGRGIMTVGGRDYTFTEATITLTSDPLTAPPTIEGSEHTITFRHELINRSKQLHQEGST
jgi:hypothetical protein